jgi:Xaa-Pro aminopeptidase
MLREAKYLEKFNRMQQLTVAVTQDIAKQIQPGQTEKEIVDMYYDALARVGLKDHWYPALVYVGESTALPISRRYHLPSPDVVVQENDIVMLDCTPLDETVWSNWAETFMVGHDQFFETLINDSQQIVDQVYAFAISHAKTIGDIYEYAIKLINAAGFTSLDPMGDVGHSIFQVPAGQTVDKTPQEDRLFIYSKQGDRPIEGIVSIEPQIGKKHPKTGKLYSTKMQKVLITPSES